MIAEEMIVVDRSKCMERILAAADKAADAHEELRRTIRDEFPPGTHVRWVHGHYPQMGIVTNGLHLRNELRVKNIKTGKTVWLRAGDVWKLQAPDEALIP